MLVLMPAPITELYWFPGTAAKSAIGSLGTDPRERVNPYGICSPVVMLFLRLLWFVSCLATPHFYLPMTVALIVAVHEY